MKISVFGTGYVGLVAGACFADKGNNVVCVDVDAQKIENLKRGVIPIYEPGLVDLIESNRDRLHFTTDARKGVEGCEVIFLAVGTPQKKGSNEADLQYLEAAAVTIAKLMTEDKVIAIKSTVPVGTAKHIQKIMSEHTKHKVYVVSNPEFLKEGDAIRDFESPDRVVIGIASQEPLAVMRELYEPFFRRNDRLFVMDNESAELAKYGTNIMLAARISVMNELARVAEATGADIMAARQGIAADSRIGHHFLYPSPGYGGSCFPKDVRALGAIALHHGVQLSLIPSIDVANEDHKSHFAQKVVKLVSKHGGKTVAVWGSSFKPKTDDIRESSALVLIEALLDAGMHVQLYDPEALENTKKRFGDKIAYSTQYQCLKGADCLVVMTDWNEFKNPDFPHIKSLLSKPIIVDGRNLYNIDRMHKEGFTYLSVGRPAVQ